MVVKELKSVSHLCNKRLELPSCQGREVLVAQPARVPSPDKNTFLWAQDLAAWPKLKTFPGGEEVHSGCDQRLFCLRYAESVCRLWVVFGAGDVRGRTAPCPPEVKAERDMWVWNWISVARLEWALNYVPVRHAASGRSVLQYDNNLNI